MVIALAACAFAACSGGPRRLRVDIATNVVPELEFDRAELVFADGATVGQPASAFTAQEWYDGARVGGLDESPQIVRFRARLLLGSAVVLERPVSARIDQGLIVKVLLSRDCRDLVCPGSGDGPGALACHGRTCVDEACVSGNEPSCPAPRCADDDACPAPGVACARAVCFAGACDLVSDCGPEGLCDVATGRCAPRGVGTDGGLAAAVDAMVDPALRAPRQLAPLSTSTVTSQRPTLRWDPAPDTDGAQIELCRDRAMSVGCLPLLEATGDRVRPTAPLAAGWWFWRARGRASARVGTDPSATWQFLVGSRSAPGDVDTSWGASLDVNGDGYVDLAVGAPFAMDSEGRAAAGAVSVYLGSASGLSATPAWTFGGEAGEEVGTVASAGDVNGDGFGDLVVGAPATNDGEPGNVRVFFGAASGLDASRVHVVSFEETTSLGVTVASAGDLDGDGFADLALGASMSPAGGRVEAGRVHVLFGAREAIDFHEARVDGPAAGDAFGFALGSGDVDGDGRSELVIGAYNATRDGRSQTGEVSVFRATAGRTLEQVQSYRGTVENELFGISTTVADFDGDGFADLAIGAHWASPGGRSRAGAVTIYSGSAGGLGASASSLLEGAVAGDWFGVRASSSDVDGDGFADLLVGASFATFDGRASAGAVRVFRGGAAGVLAAPLATLGGRSANDRAAECTAGDFDGSGRADVVVAARNAAPAGRAGAGLVFVHRSRAVGVDAEPSAALDNGETGGGFGASVAAR